MPFLKDKRQIYMTRSQKLIKMSQRNGIKHACFNYKGDSYKGNWVDDRKRGKGVLLTKKEPQIYEGDFRNGLKDGFGVLAYQIENKTFLLEYRGGWLRDKMHGFGLRKYRDGGVYLGYWKYGKRHGPGQMWYTDGGFYDGDWSRDKRHGLGLYVRADGNRYEGAWACDMKWGKGRFYHIDSGQMQEGVWHRDICVYSTVSDIPYRQSSVFPTEYYIGQVELQNLKGVCDVREMKALTALTKIEKSCLSLPRPRESMVSAKA